MDHGKGKLKFYTTTKDDFFLTAGIKTLKAPHTDYPKTTLTDCNIRKPMGELPYLSGSAYMGKISHGDPVIEDSIVKTGWSSQSKKKSDSIPMFHDKSFYIFGDSFGIPFPDASLSVETPSKGFVNGRKGMGTRLC
jgi:hypothetical protein